MICPRVVKDKRPSSVQSEEEDVPARTCGIRRRERTCAQVKAHEHSYLMYGMAYRSGDIPVAGEVTTSLL